MIVINKDDNPLKKIGFYNMIIPTKSCIVKINDESIDITSLILPDIHINDMSQRHIINIDKIINDDNENITYYDEVKSIIKLLDDVFDNIREYDEESSFSTENDKIKRCIDRLNILTSCLEKNFTLEEYHNETTL